MTSLFVPYGAPLPLNLVEQGIRVVGINMSNPPWKDQLPDGIKLITTADVSSYKMGGITPTIEHAWGLIMAAHRRLVAAAQDAFGDRNNWLAPYQLSKQTLGIIGYGRIGRAVGHIGAAFGMCVRDYDPYVAGGRKLNEVLSSEVVFISCTLNKTSRRLLTGKLGLMKPDSILVSVAPWEIVDPVEVVMALSEDRLRAAAFDDWPPHYNTPLMDKLRENGRLTITPHIAGSALDARIRTEQLVKEVMHVWLEANPLECTNE